VLPTTRLLTFAVTAFALIAVPGPSVLFTVSRAIALGRVAGVATVAGNALGAFVQVVAVAFGIGPLVERSVTLFTVMKLAAAGYLMFLGVRAIRHRRSLAAALGAEVERKTTGRIVLDGFTVGATNPKVIVFFAAMLPQFVDRQAGGVPAQIMLLGAVFAAIALVSDGTWALVAGTARAWLARSPRRLELIGGTSGLVMIGIGTRLALTGRNDLRAAHDRRGYGKGGTAATPPNQRGSRPPEISDISGAAAEGDHDRGSNGANIATDDPRS
jgi:threonine/homoserine/homoserine lactone efflux protein